jgi:arginine exporter protein ArgO
MKILYLWVPNLADLLEKVKSPLKESNMWQIIGLITAIVIALLLYKLKKRMIIIFSFIEIMGGAWTIWSTFTQSFESSVLYALAIAGGIFLLVNGFENFIKYKKETESNDETNIE